MREYLRSYESALQNLFNEYHIPSIKDASAKINIIKGLGKACLNAGKDLLIDNVSAAIPHMALTRSEWLVWNYWNLSKKPISSPKSWRVGPTACIGNEPVLSLSK